MLLLCLKNESSLPSHVTDKVMSFVHELELPSIVRTFQPLHEIGQSLLQKESIYPYLILPKPALRDT